MIVVLTNADVFDGERRLGLSSVVIENGAIGAIIPAGEELPDGEMVDLDGALLAPGFVDVQVNGGGGVMFNNARSVEGLRRVAEAHRQFGTTTIVPTLITDTAEVMAEAASAVRAAMARQLAGVRGVHFEGPCLSPARPGVHRQNCLRRLDREIMDIYTTPGMGQVVVTLAPEVVPPDDIAALNAAGVLVCAGHSDASYDQVRTALKAGVRGFTHLYNAMSPMANREPGVVGAALDDAASWCGIIIDGYHLHDATARAAVRAKAQGRMMLVTDAMGSVGARDKSFELYGTRITARDGRCATADGTLAGSDLDMASAVRNTHRRLGLPLEEALRMAALYPAQFLKLDHRIGRIRRGYDADLVALDADTLTVRQSWVAGESGNAGRTAA